MGFFDNYDDSSFGAWIGKEEKAELVASGDSFLVKAVTIAQFADYDPKFVLTIELDGEERAISFPVDGVPGRARLLNALIEYFKGEDAEPVELRIEMAGKAQLLVNANAPVGS